MNLHVACLPFPSHQGTQAALAAMLRASAEAGRETHVLTYAHGAYPLEVPYQVHRVADFPKVRSLRSGPSWGKVALDARCIAATRRLTGTLRPDAVIAHHVEAALAVLRAGVRPVYYVAHTSLEKELSVYFPRVPAAAVSHVGGLLDRWVTSQVDGVAAVAPSLASLLGPHTTYLPVPWSPEPPSLRKDEARDALGLPRNAHLCLYAGNLDRYQGWELLLEALRALHKSHPQARLLIASESDPTPAQQEAAKRGVAPYVDLRRLDSELARTRAHAASDLAWIPRQTEGGLPIKMLDAFGRSLPVVATRRATAGLPIVDACHIVEDDDPAALAEATADLLDEEPAREALRASGLRYLTRHHSAVAFLAGLDAMLEPFARRARARSHAPHRPAAPELRAR
jgi:glycosyltransferase involved in cell wall biosynthesis